MSTLHDHATGRRDSRASIPARRSGGAPLLGYGHLHTALDDHASPPPAHPKVHSFSNGRGRGP